MDDRPNGLDISVMTPDDVAFAVEMTDHEQWGNVPADFQRIIAFEPDGCFVARLNGERVGMITSTTSDDYAFLGSLIVRSEQRGKGFGEALMRHALNFVDSRGAKTVELDGVFAATGLYRRLGFNDKYLSLRLFRPPQSGDDEQIVVAPPLPGPIEATTHEIITYDKSRTGLDRERLITRYLEEFADRVYIVGGSAISGYAVLRPSSDNCFGIGPVVADDTRSAEAVIGLAVTDHSSHGLGIGVPAPADAIAEALLRLGFRYQPPSLRMYRGQKRDFDTHSFGILSPAMG